MPDRIELGVDGAILKRRRDCFAWIRCGQHRASEEGRLSAAKKVMCACDPRGGDVSGFCP